MPIHEYRCTQCGHEFEELLRTSRQKVACPQCGSTRLTRKLSTFAAVVDQGGGTSCPRGDGCPEGGCCSGGLCNLADN